ncbi:MAG: hypothetical protein ACLRXQ_00285 [Phascolarctobacterium faecium]
MAKEAENANEIIHYFAQEWAPGVVIHMQTMYMTWITMAIVFLLFFIASRNSKLVPSGLQNGMEFLLISKRIDGRDFGDEGTQVYGAVYDHLVHVHFHWQ